MTRHGLVRTGTRHVDLCMRVFEMRPRLGPAGSILPDLWNLSRGVIASGAQLSDFGTLPVHDCYVHRVGSGLPAF